MANLALVHSVFGLSDGGSEKFFSESLHFLKRELQSHQFHVISSNNSFQLRSSFEHQCIHHYLPSVYLSRYNAPFSIGVTPYLYALTKRYAFRVFHLHSPIFPLCLQIQLLRSVLKGSKSIVTMHSSYSAMSHPLFRSYETVYRGLFLPYILKKANYITVVSNTLKQFVMERHSLPTERVIVVPNSIAVQRYVNADPRSREELHLQDDDVVLTYAGRFTAGKGIADLIHAFKLVLADNPHVKLLLVGDGEIRPRLKALVHTLHLDPFVKFTGFRRDIPAILATSDVFCHLHFETGVPTSILEAMAAGKPLVVSSTPAVKEAVPSDGAVFVHPKNHTKTAASISELLKDNNTMKAMGKSNRQKCLKEFDLENNFKGFLQIYDTLLDH